MKSSYTESLAHTTWECKYHIVFAPKFRRKEIYGKIRKDIGVIIRRLCEQKGIEIKIAVIHEGKESRYINDYKLKNILRTKNVVN